MNLLQQAQNLKGVLHGKCIFSEYQDLFSAYLCVILQAGILSVSDQGGHPGIRRSLKKNDEL